MLFSLRRETECHVLRASRESRSISWSNFNFLSVQSVALHTNRFIFYNNGRTINRYITHPGTCTSVDKEKWKKKTEKERGRGTPSLPHYIELRDTMGSPKHKTGRECSGALLYRRYNSSVMPLFNHRYDRSLHSPSCVRPPERRNPAAPTNVKVNWKTGN